MVNLAHSLWVNNNTIELKNISTLSSNAWPACGIRCINVSAQKNFYVQNNIIKLINPDLSINWPSMGIYLEASKGALVSGNTIANTNGNSTTFNTTQQGMHESFGIMVRQSPQSYLISNTTSWMKAGIAAESSSNDNQFGCNNFDKCYDGFMFYNAIIGNQLNNGLGTGNNWNLASNPSRDIDGQLLTGNSINWNYGTYQPNIMQLGQITLIGGQNEMDCGANTGGGGGGSMLSSVTANARELLYGKIVRGETTYDTLELEYKGRDSAYCYKQLLNNDTLQNMGTVDDSLYQNFVSACAALPIGKLNDVDMALADTLPSRFDEALLKNQNIVTNNTVDENAKYVNELYIRKLKYEADSLNTEGNLYVFDSTEIATLESVAYQNPVLGGNSVFLARILLWIEVIDDHWATPERRNQNFVKEDNRYGFKLYPNPSSGQVTLDYVLQENETGELGIYSSAGIAIKKYTFANNNNSLNVNESTLKSGTYIYAIKVNGQLVKMDKLVIVK